MRACQLVRWMQAALAWCQITVFLFLFTHTEREEFLSLLLSVAFCFTLAAVVCVGVRIIIFKKFCACIHCVRELREYYRVDGSE